MSTPTPALPIRPVTPAPRIRSIEVSDFRAFPASCPGKFDLGADGKNLLIFGENGSGKSSLYRALRGFFNVTPQSIMDSRNVFTEPPQSSVTIQFTGGAPKLNWNAGGHPTAEVRDTARRSAFLTYTRLREMNTGLTPTIAPNLFRVAVEHLVADFEATITGGARRTIAELWTDLGVAVRHRVTTVSGQKVARGYRQSVEAAIDRLNEGMRLAIGALEAQAKLFLEKLLDSAGTDGTELIGLTYSGPQFNDLDRETVPEGTLTASIRFRTHRPEAPQNFINEARQTAVAIAIFLAGRLCVPADAALKLLVLDDLLISLDSSHRYPILAAITEAFADWQIILLTHDRDWFEAAREKLKGGKWKAVEIFESKGADGLLMPLIKLVDNDVVEGWLKQAEKFVEEDHLPAAANYARSACELVLQRYCKEYSIPIPYQGDGHAPTLNVLRDKALAFAEGKSEQAALLELNRHQRFVFNPLSHRPTAAIPKGEVKASIVAVRAAAVACKR